MAYSVIRTATIRDIPSIVKIRLATLAEEEISGFSAPEFAYLAKSKGCSHMKTDTTENANGIAWRSYGFWTSMGYKDTGIRLPTKYSFKEIPFVKNLK
jgi:hypothetical protein